MAGIGFELRKVASLGSARGLFQAAFSGIMIVAGPWLISIVTILLLQQPVLGIPEDFRHIFIASTIYIYAVSLILSGGFHYIFTRILSDYLYRNEPEEAMGMTIRYILLSSLFLLPIAVLLQRFCIPSPEASLIHKGAFILLFVVINHIWVLMLTASAMKKFHQLLVVFTLGMASSLLFMRIGLLLLGNDTLLMAYTLGQLLLGVLLTFFLLKEMGFKKVPLAADFFKYMTKFQTLFLTGILYYGALWSDKIVYWFLKGDFIGDTRMKLYLSYDIVVYLSNLTIIPGLVFFVIFSETEFYLVLKKFLDSLHSNTYKKIRTSLYRLNRTTRFIMGEQIALQGCATLVFLTFFYFQPEWLPSNPPIILSAGAIFMLCLFLTAMNFLFYIEQYRIAFMGTAIFFLLNTGGALLSQTVPFLDLPGLSSLIGCTAGTAFLYTGLIHSLRSLDQIIFTAITENQLRDSMKTVKKKGK